ncbi:MAG TPA: RDD family protein [Mycobacteriales bacterium]|nr:RDD family protein [Mycobacteriales bacterium]
MTEGGGGDQYRDQYREGPFPPAPPPPWADPAPTSHQGPPPGQQPAYGQGDMPSGQQPAYGQTSAMPPYSDQQQPYGYGQQPYGQQYPQSPWGSAPPGYARPPADLASWPARAGALILDGIFGLLLAIPAGIAFGVTFGTADTSTNSDGTTEVTNLNGGLLALAIVLAIAAVVVGIWNQGWRQGSLGWSWGKQVVGITLVREVDGRPPGGWTGIGRLLLRNVLGIVPFYTIVDYLWPLWDEKNQTLDDKMLSTLVVRAR